MVPTVALPDATPFTDQPTAWFVLPVTVAENCIVSPARIVLLEGVIFIPLEVGVGPEAPTFMPPPQPDHKHIANDKTTMPVNFTREDFFNPSISAPLSRRSERKKSAWRVEFGAPHVFRVAGEE
jgi:hypothetical protein